jgi:hypothetical protein
MKEIIFIEIIFYAEKYSPLYIMYIYIYIWFFTLRILKYKKCTYISYYYMSPRYLLYVSIYIK